MNEHELDVALGAIGRSRVRSTAPQELRERARAVSSASSQVRGWLPRLRTGSSRPMFGASGLVVFGAFVALVGGLLFSTTVERDGAGSPAATGIGEGRFDPTGALVEARALHVAVLLPDDRVLVTGGLQAVNGVSATEDAGLHVGLASAELYDPRTGMWTLTGSMDEGRMEPSSTLLADGTVLVAGGLGSYSDDPYDPGVGLASAELYDSRTGTWSMTAPMGRARAGHTATVLPDGRVLIAGGRDPSQPRRSMSTGTCGWAECLASAELYDPASGSWAATADLHQAREGHTATLLSDGRVLVAGGGDGDRISTAELYDPATGTWTMTGMLPEPFGGHVSTLLPSGCVLVVGGDVPTGGGATGSPHAALYDPGSGTWTMTASMRSGRLGHTGTMLADGRVLIVGGRRHGGPDSEMFIDSELYDPVTTTWADSGDMTLARSGHTATLLHDGHVLVVGGDDGPGETATAETWASPSDLRPVGSPADQDLSTATSGCSTSP